MYSKDSYSWPVRVHYCNDQNHAPGILMCINAHGSSHLNKILLPPPFEPYRRFDDYKALILACYMSDWVSLSFCVVDLPANSTLPPPFCTSISFQQGLPTLFIRLLTWPVKVYNCNDQIVHLEY